MNANEQIDRFYEFLEKSYKEEIIKQASKENKRIIIDFTILSMFDPELADLLLEDPENVTKAGETAIERFDVGGLRVRFTNLPSGQQIFIRNIRSKDLGKFLAIEGVIRQKSDVRPQVTIAKFECPSCGQTINVPQIDTSFKEPSRCSCGRKGKFRLISKELVDAQGIVLEEDPEQLEGGLQPKRMNVFLSNDLVSPLSEMRSGPGSKIRVNGVVKEVPIILRTGSKSTRFELLIEANNVEVIEETFSDIEISEEEEKRILDIANSKEVFKKLSASVAPSIFGHERIKDALILQMFGGVSKTRVDGAVSRGDIHMLLIGDPGAAKSQMLKRANIIAPKSRYVSGKGVSAAGLTASVVKDEFLKGWSLEAGAMVLASNGLCCTTEDSRFILKNGKKKSFKELFKNTKSSIIFPKFEILALNKNTLKIEPFKIKKAFRIKNDKKIIHITTRTGRELNLTQDNEVYVCRASKIFWKPVGEISKNDFIAVPNKLHIKGEDKYHLDFAYIAGLIASDGNIKIDSRHATTSFYNTNILLVELFKEKMNSLGYKYSTFVQKKGRKSKIRGKNVVSKKDLYKIYNSTKKFAVDLIDFGVPSGNKSTNFVLNDKILTYSDEIIAKFLRGVFDGDGSIRLNPIEVIITSGIKENVTFFKEALLRIGILSSVKKSTNSWHCEVRGATRCAKFFEVVGTNHVEKYKRFEKISPKEVKDRIDVLPNHQDFFKNLLKKYRWKLGKSKFKYFWNYTRKGVLPSRYKLAILNKLLEDEYLMKYIEGDIFWDKVESIEDRDSEFVYDFTMKGTDNFIANNIIMHNCIDEMDKMSAEDTAAMHEAMENQTVSISKANIQATLIARTTVLAAANPKFGRFNPYEIIAKQINMPPALINRFDLIFPIKDIPDVAKDELLASHILHLHQSPDFEVQEIDTNLLKKYVAYAKQKIRPQLTDSALEEIKKYYVEMRNKDSDESSSRAIPISPRQLEALVRLSEASAKVRLSDKVTKRDARRAIDIAHYCLHEVGLDPETGKIDIDRITTGISASQRSHIIEIKEIISELENKLGKTIPIDDIVAMAKDKGIGEDKTEEVIEKLKRSGDLFEPRRGIVSKL